MCLGIVRRPAAAAGSYELDTAPLRRYGRRRVHGFAASGAFGASKSTVLRGLCLQLGIPNSHFLVDNSVHHTTGGIMTGGGSRDVSPTDSLCAYDVEGENLGDARDDAMMKAMTALLQSAVHIHVIKDAMANTDVDRLQALAAAYEVNRLSLAAGAAAAKPVLIIWLRTLRPEPAGGWGAYVADMLAGRAVLDKFSSLHVEKVTDDGVRAQQCLRHDHFVPTEFPEFHAAIQRVAAVVQRALDASVAARRALTGDEMARLLEAAWPALLAGRAVPMPSLRHMIANTRATAIARDVAAALPGRLAAVTANPFSVASVTDAVALQLQQARADYDAAGAAALAALAPELPAAIAAVFDQVVKPAADAVLTAAQATRDAETAQLQNAVAAARAEVTAAAAAAQQGGNGQINFGAVNARFTAALVTLQAAVNASRVPGAANHVAVVRDAALAEFNNLVLVAQNHHLTEANRLRSLSTPEVSVAIPRAGGSAFEGNGSATFVYNVRGNCPAAVCADAVNPRVALSWTSGNHRSPTYPINPNAPHALYSERDPGRKWHSHQVTWDGTNVVFNLASDNWGNCGGNPPQHDVHSVVVKYQLTQLHGSPYAAPFVAPQPAF